MKNKLLLFCLSFSILAHAQNTVVKTANGKVEGRLNDDKTVRIFKKIPFAAPPVGDLRWKAPQKVENWSGIRACTEFSASPIQNKPEPFLCWSKEFIAQPEPLSEDCLYLNVWTSAKSKKEKQPVLIWIYGGGLSSGSANCAIYDGAEISKKGIIFVSINYRVGVLGFMAHPELSKESGHTASGNYGFLDQIAALKWVQKNIAAFGGDPNHVTIAGQSAGSFSVNALVASPLSKGLFHGAIAQSGGLLSNRLIQNLADAEKQGLKVMQKAKVASIAELRKMRATDLQNLSNQQDIGRFGTTLDGYVLPNHLLEHFQKGLHNQVPLLTGWVTGDGALFGNPTITAEQFKKDAQAKYGARTPEFLSIFPVSTDEEAQNVQKTLNLFNFAAMPSHLWAGCNSQKTYMYQFNRVPPDKPNFPNYGAFHTSEVPYALHTLHTWDRAWQQTDKNIENIMSSYWVQFVKTGNPNANHLPEWKSYNKQFGNILILGEPIESKPALLKQAFDFLEVGF
jgi:para-nitrobenzyl esterase